jgi:DNA polymerase III epsilon subunit-like protein
MKVLVFDTETSGLSKTKIINLSTIHLWPFIVQFSYIIFDTDTCSIAKMYDTIIKVKPYNVISEESSKIHGITNEISTNKGVDIQQVLFDFCSDMNEVDLIVAHNINFDLPLIKVELLRCMQNNIDTNDTIYTLLKDNFETILNKKEKYCTMENSIDLCKIERENSRGKYFKFPTLTELHVYLFNVIPNNLHNSLNDILITLRCFMKMKYDVDIIEKNNIIRNMILLLL